jgi:hypothetical protein
VLSSSFQWLVHLIEALAAIAALLSVGAVLALAAFGLLSRAGKLLAGPQPDEPEKYDPDLDPGAGPVISIPPDHPKPPA